MRDHLTLKMGPKDRWRSRNEAEEMDVIKEMIRPRRRKKWRDRERKGQRMDANKVVKEEKSHDGDEINGMSLRMVSWIQQLEHYYASSHGLASSL